MNLLTRGRARAVVQLALPTFLSLTALGCGADDAVAASDLPPEQGGRGAESDRDDEREESPRAPPSDDKPPSRGAQPTTPSKPSAQPTRPSDPTPTRPSDKAPADDPSPVPTDEAAGCLQGKSADYKDKGPYAVKSQDVTVGNLGRYTIFYPATLDARCKHPIVAWGNGTGVAGSAIYAHWQQHAASWGMVVIASHSAGAGAMRYLEGGIDHLLAENARAGSDFQGKLSARAGVAGHSQGGIAATTAARHQNVVAEVCVQGGGLPPPKVAFMCLTGTGDFLRGMCTSAYNTAKGPSFLADLQGADHIGTPTLLGAFSPQGAEMVRLYTAWFRCHLGGDGNACKLFQGEPAPVCGQGAMFAGCKGKGGA